MDSYVYENDSFMDIADLLPMKQISFEGIDCYLPNHVENMLSYNYHDYNNFPKDFSFRHLGERAERQKRDYPYGCIVFSGLNKYEEGKRIYYLMRKNKIYCVLYCDISDENLWHAIQRDKLEFINCPDEIKNMDFIVKDYKSGGWDGMIGKEYLFDEISEDVICELQHLIAVKRKTYGV